MTEEEREANRKRFGPMNPYDYPPGAIGSNALRLLGAGQTCGTCAHFGSDPERGACGKAPRPWQNYCAWRSFKFEPKTKRKE